MSSRAYRRLHGDGLSGLAGEVDEDLDLGPVPVRANKKKGKSKVINPFDLLADGEEGKTADENTFEDDKNETESGDDKNDIESSDETANKVVKKKNKKQKKKKKILKENNDENKVEDIDAAIREVNELYGDEIGACAALSFDPGHQGLIKSILSIESKNLNPDNEMRRIFGSRIVQSENNRKRHRNRPYHKSCWLVQPKENWHPVGRLGLTMKLCDTKDQVQSFAFEHSSIYQQIQFQFWDAVESLDPQNIVNVLNNNPYHIDSLIQLSEVCRMSEDNEMARELIERALYTFECNFHSVFNLAKGTCRLDYKYPENRSFFIALMRHLQFIGARGCYRTALEFCKLILSLDPENDPVCVLLMIDFYAIRSEQYEFLIRMHDEWEVVRNLSQLPNFAFSVPLALFHQASDARDVLTKADSALQDALLMFPGLVITLLDTCSVQPDTRVSHHPFFANSIQSPDLKTLLALYIGRANSLWKVPEVMEWLERNVREVLQLVDKKDPRVEDYRIKRESRYRGTPRNIYRHILMSEIKDATAALPPSMANTPILSYDPLPPSDSVTSYTRPERSQQLHADPGILSMFIRSLMPNFNPTVPSAPVPNATDQQIGNLMDAMRDLLANIQPVAPPLENQPPQNNNNDNEENDDNDHVDHDVF